MAGRARSIRLVFGSLVEAVPATFTILVDRSQSMSRRINMVREAAAGLTSKLRESDLVAVVPFAKEIGPVTGPTNDRETVRDAISTIQATVQGRHAIVLITDGYDEHKFGCDFWS